MDKYEASQQQFQTADDFDAFDLNCAAIDPPSNMESFVDQAIASLMTTIDLGFRDVHTDVQNIINSHPFYIMFEPALGCDTNTDHVTPKSVLPVFSADLTDTLSALQCRISSALEPTIRKLISDRESIIFETVDEQASSQKQSSESASRLQKEVEALRAAVADLRHQKDEVHDRLMKEINMLREQLFQKKVRVGQVYRPDFAPGSGTEAGGLLMNFGQSSVLTHAEVDAIVKELTDRHTEERRRTESKLRSELQALESHLVKISLENEGYAKRCQGLETELATLQKKYDTDMEGQRVYYDEQVDGLNAQLAALNEAHQGAMDEFNAEIGRREGAQEKMSSDYADALKREEALKAQLERERQGHADELDELTRAHRLEADRLAGLLDEERSRPSHPSSTLDEELRDAHEKLRASERQNKELADKYVQLNEEMERLAEELRQSHERDMDALKDDSAAIFPVTDVLPVLKEADDEFQQVLRCINLIFGNLFDEEAGAFTRMLVTRDFSARDYGVHSTVEDRRGGDLSASQSGADEMDGRLADASVGDLSMDALRHSGSARPSKAIPTNYIYKKVEKAVNHNRLGKVANKYLGPSLKMLLKWSQLYANDRLHAHFGASANASAGVGISAGVGAGGERARASDSLNTLVEQPRSLGGAHSKQGISGADSVAMGTDAYPDAHADIDVDAYTDTVKHISDLDRMGLGSITPIAEKADASSRIIEEGSSPVSSSGVQKPLDGQSAGLSSLAKTSPGDGLQGGSGRSDAQYSLQFAGSMNGDRIQGHMDASGWDSRHPQDEDSGALHEGYDRARDRDGKLSLVNTVLLREDALLSNREPNPYLNGKYAPGFPGPEESLSDIQYIDVGVNTLMCTSLAECQYELSDSSFAMVDKSIMYECSDCLSVRRSLSADQLPHSTSVSVLRSTTNINSRSTSRPQSDILTKGSALREGDLAGDGGLATDDSKARGLSTNDADDTVDNYLDAIEDGDDTNEALFDAKEPPERVHRPEHDSKSPSREPTLSKPGTKGQSEADPFICPKCNFRIPYSAVLDHILRHKTPVGFPALVYDESSAHVPLMRPSSAYDRRPASTLSDFDSAAHAGQQRYMDDHDVRDASEKIDRLSKFLFNRPPDRPAIFTRPMVDGVFTRLLKRAAEMRSRYLRKRELILQERRRTTERVLRALSLLNEATATVAARGSGPATQKDRPQSAPRTAYSAIPPAVNYAVPSPSRYLNTSLQGASTGSSMLNASRGAPASTTQSGDGSISEARLFGFQRPQQLPGRPQSARSLNSALFGNVVVEDVVARVTKPSRPFSYMPYEAYNFPDRSIPSVDSSAKYRASIRRSIAMNKQVVDKVTGAQDVLIGGVDKYEIFPKNAYMETDTIRPYMYVASGIPPGSRPSSGRPRTPASMMDVLAASGIIRRK